MPILRKDLRKVKLLIFDLDGTLVDSALDLALSVNAMREKMGLGPLPHVEIATYVGQGVAHLMRRSLGEPTTDEKIQQALDFFLAYYREHMLDNTVTYPGVREALEELKDHHLAVLSNKPVRFSELILEGLGLLPHFRYVYGGNSFEQKKPDPMGALQLMDQFKVRLRETLIIGDSETDVRTGKNAGIWTCGVTYGFGSYTLETAPPDFLVDDLRELPPLLDGHSAESRGRSAESGRQEAVEEPSFKPLGSIQTGVEWIFQK